MDSLYFVQVSINFQMQVISGTLFCVVFFLLFLAFLYVLYVSHKLNFIMLSSRLSDQAW